MSCILHLSDPHFGTEQAPVMDALERFAHELRPDLVLLSGDITQRARRAQFAAARAFADRLRAPALLAVPGNHDIPLFNLAARLFAPYGNYTRAFGAELEPQFADRDLLVVAVNTTRPARHKNGVVSAAQIERVSARLAQAQAGQLRVVLVHQPIAVLRPEDEHDRLRGAEAAIEAWSAAGADLVVGGHIHLPYVLALHERAPGLPRPLWAVQAGTSVSSRVRGAVPNSVNVIRWSGDLPAGVCLVERWDHAAAAQAFERVAVHELRPGVPVGA